MPSDSASASRTLLLVDDEENILAALTRLLRRDGYRILRAGGGREALDMLAREPVGVILSDQRMPGMSGVEFLREARRGYPDTVRIVLSGYTELKSVTDAINEGAVYKFLTKPWEDDLLRANITEAFEHYQLVSENRRLANELRTANEELTTARRELEQLLSQKAREALQSGKALRVSQEILECLPVGVIGIDDSGMIAVANRRAGELFGGEYGLLVGRGMEEALPPDIAARVRHSLDEDADGQHPCHLPDGSGALSWCQPLRNTSEARGVVLLFLPAAGARS